MKTRIIQDIDYCENMIIGKQLAFERAMERFDIDAANIACAQKEFWQKELEIKRKQTVKMP